MTSGACVVDSSTLLRVLYSFKPQSRGLGLGFRLHDVLSPSRGLCEPFPTASDGSGYRGSAGLGLRLQAEPFTSLVAFINSLHLFCPVPHCILQEVP